MAAHFGVVGRVAEEVGQYLRESILVGVHDQARRRYVDREQVVTLLEKRAHHLDGKRYDLRHLHRGSLKRDLPAHEASDVEQVVDEPNEMVCLPFDDIELLRGLPGGAHLEESHRRDNGCEWIPELM